MDNRKQKATGSRQTAQTPIIPAEQWVELTRKLMQKAHSGFSRKELATISGFINYVAPSVEAIQQQSKDV